MRSVSRIPSKTGGKVRLDDGKFGKFSVRLDFGTSLPSSQTCPRRSGLANNHEQTQSCLQSAFIWRMSVDRALSLWRGFEILLADHADPSGPPLRQPTDENMATALKRFPRY